MHYPDFFARFYDVVYARIRTIDHDYYLKRIAETKGSVLEIGVGTGRFFKEAIDAGADIYGIDANESMLNILRQKLGPEFHDRIFLQQVQELHLDKKFDLIIAPFRVFSHLIPIEDQLNALNRISEHLNPGGKFIFDLFVPDYKRLSEGFSEVTDFEGEYEPGKRLKRIVSSKSNTIEQINEVTMKLVWDENGKENEGSWTFLMRYYFRWELEHLIPRSKLKLEKIYGDYNEGELTNESKDFVVVCKKQ